MTDPEPTTQILARCLEAYQEKGEVALDEACLEHPELSDRIRAAGDALRELLGAVGEGASLFPEGNWAGGKKLGRFSIGAKIGQGGMGTVHEAFDPDLKRKVAIKLFPSPLPQSELSLERFRREAESLAKMRHPHIVPILEVGETEELQPYMVMQYVEGASLGKMLGELTVEDEQLPETWIRLDQGGYWKTITRVVADVADAIQHAHEQGLVHRDVKPGNILIDEGGQAILIDFGVARILDQEQLTMSGAMLGTPAFMAPEQIRDPGGVGPCTDVYALGATLYQCLTLQLPFDAASQEEFYDKICRKEPLAPRAVRAEIPKDLETICLTAMAKSPTDRYSSAGQLRDDLVRFLDYRPILARPIGPLARAGRWARRNQAAALALVMVLLVVILGPSSYALYMHSIAVKERSAKESIQRESQQKEQAQAMAAFSAGRLLAQRGRWEEALVQYAAAAAHHPDPVLVDIGRIEALEGNLDTPAAVKVLSRLRQQCLPQAYEAKLLLLDADLGVNRLVDPDAKMDLVERALAMNALGPADTLLARAMKASTVAEALKLLRRARRIDPNHRRINDCFAVLLMASGHRAELAQFCQELRAIYPDDPTTALLEDLVRELNFDDGRDETPSALAGNRRTHDQQLILAFVGRAAAFLHEYDNITRSQLLDFTLGRKPRGKSAIVKQTLGLALEAKRLLQTQRSSRSGGRTYFRVLPVVAGSLTRVLREMLRILAMRLISKPDPSAIIRELDRAHETLSDAVYAQGAGMWCLKIEDLVGAERRFEAASRASSLVLSRRTSLLYLSYTRHALFLAAKDRHPKEALQYQTRALASIRDTLAAGADSPDECRFLFECAKSLDDAELALRIALRWRERVPAEDRAAQIARDLGLRALLQTVESMKPATTDAERSPQKR